MGSKTQQTLLKKASQIIKNDGTIILSVYSEEAKNTQIEFYKRIGLIVKGYDKNFVYTDKFNSERFSKKKLENIFKKAGLKFKIKKLTDISYWCEVQKRLKK